MIKSESQSRSSAGGILILLLAAGSSVDAEVPGYQVETIAQINVSTFLRGASPGGHLVGSMVINGQQQAFVATSTDGVVMLPLPPGYNSADAFDANSAGTVVGTVSDAGFPQDVGEPAVWSRNAQGTYEITIPQQFASLPSPLGGNLAIQGGQIVGIDEAGTLIGWARFFGFSGGPTTLFSMSAAPIELRPLGFDATVRDLSDHNGIIVGDQLRMDLDTGVVEDLGVPNPPEGPNFAFGIAYAVNDTGRSVIAGNTTSSIPTENWLTLYHDPADGYHRLDPSKLPQRFVGFYDLNNLGDIASSTGIWFEAEQQLVHGLDTLLTDEFSNWNVGVGYINDRREVYTGAFDTTTGTSWLVRLVPASDRIFVTGFEPDKPAR